MNILDAFKQDCQENGNSSSYNAELQAEVEKQMKVMADYEANPEVLDLQIKFNEEEIPFDEKAIAKQLYIEEDGQYPAEADDPEELLNMTLAGVNESDTPINSNIIPDAECNEVKVGDKLKVYHYSGFINGECEVSKIMKVFGGGGNEHSAAARIKGMNIDNIKKILCELLVPAGYLDYVELNTIREEKGMTLNLTK